MTDSGSHPGTGAPSSRAPGNVTLSGYEPGALGRVTELHGAYYHQHWDFGLYFEAKVATELSAFLNRLDPARDGFWIAKSDGRIVGSISLDGSGDPDNGPRIRWFIVEQGLAGRGVGRALMSAAMAFCRSAGHEHVYLWTFAGLDAARKLYEDFGFALTQEHDDAQWGKVVHEQRFEWRG